MKQLLAGKDVSAALLPRLQEKARALKARGIVPTLAAIRLGTRMSDVRYETNAKKRCEKIGIAFRSFVLPEGSSQKELLQTIRKVNQDLSIHGCLIFRPFPKDFDDALIRASLSPDKDVDGITDSSLAGIFTGTDIGFPPCTAAACMEILDHYGIDVRGKDVVVIGASLVIGRPVAMEFLKREATVSICHIRTKDVKKYCRQADIIVSAAGCPHLLTADMVKPGQTIIDVGINAAPDGSICGDVDFSGAAPIVDAITPVPGGVGSVTTAVLAQHVIEAAERSQAASYIPHTSPDTAQIAVNDALRTESRYTE